MYTFCKRNNIPGFSDDEQMAGRKWMNSFTKRHPKLSLTTPEKKSMQGAVGFNKAVLHKYLNDELKYFARYNFSLRLHRIP